MGPGGCIINFATIDSVLSGRSMPVVRTIRVRVDRVQFPASRPN